MASKRQRQIRVQQSHWQMPPYYYPHGHGRISRENQGQKDFHRRLAHHKKNGVAVKQYSVLYIYTEFAGDQVVELAIITAQGVEVIDTYLLHDRPWSNIYEESSPDTRFMMELQTKIPVGQPLQLSTWEKAYECASGC